MGIRSAISRISDQSYHTDKLFNIDFSIYQTTENQDLPNKLIEIIQDTVKLYNHQ